MMRTIDVDEGALLQAKHTADRAQSHAYREIGSLNDRIGRASAASSAARGIISARFGQVNTNIGTCQARLGQVESRLSLAKSALASCRPPYYETVAHSNGNGGIYYTHEFRDPDAGKREQAKAEIAECESKISILQSALSEMRSVLTRYHQGLAWCQQVDAGLASASSALSHASDNLERDLADVERTIQKAEMCLSDYEHVRLEGVYDGMVPDLPLLQYSGGRVTYAEKGRATASVHTAPASGPIDEKANKPFKDKAAFVAYVDALIAKAHGAPITIRIPRAMTNFPKTLPLLEVAAILEARGFVSKRNSAGLRLVDPEGYYRFTKDS